MTNKNIKIAETPWSRSCKQIAKDLQVSPQKGLNPEDVRVRRRSFGPNRLRTKKWRPAWAILAGWPLLLPLQILYLNMIGDVFPALALALGTGDPLSIRQPPRSPNEPIITRSHWLTISGNGVLITVCVLIAYALAFR
jgi:magnesium-transporting ATPase (P-type)